MLLIVEQKFLGIELAVASLFTVALLAYGYLLDGNCLVGQLIGGNRSTVYGTFASIFASLFGFTLAAIAFVIGLSNREARFSDLRTSERYDTLWKAYMSAIWWLGFATIVSLIGLVADRGESPLFLLVYLMCFTVILVSLRMVNCVLLLGLILEVATEPSKERPGGR